MENESRLQLQKLINLNINLELDVRVCFPQKLQQLCLREYYFRILSTHVSRKRKTSKMVFQQSGVTKQCSVFLRT